MRILEFWTLGLVLNATAAAAAAQNDVREDTDLCGDWHLIGYTNGESTAEYIRAIARAGAAVQFEVLTVHRDPQRTATGRSFDNVQETYLADCNTRTYRLLAHKARTGRALTPPSIFRFFPGDPPPPPEGSVLDVRIRTACGQRPLSPETIEDPYPRSAARR